MGERRCAYRVLVGKREGKRPIGRPMRRCKDKVKIDLQEIRWGKLDCIHLAQDRKSWRAVVNAVMNNQVA
jgi:hypothetical protein